MLSVIDGIEPCIGVYFNFGDFSFIRQNWTHKGKLKDYVLDPVPPGHMAIRYVSAQDSCDISPPQLHYSSFSY